MSVAMGLPMISLNFLATVPGHLGEYGAFLFGELLKYAVRKPRSAQHRLADVRPQH